MSKKTKTFPLKEFWEQKLNIKYDTEIVSRFFRKFNFFHLVSGSQPAILSDPASSAML